MSKWYKIRDTFFIYVYDGAHYLVNVLPFQVFKIENELKDAENVENYITSIEKKQIRSKSTIIGSYYLPLIISTNKCNFMCRYCYADGGSYGECVRDIKSETIDNIIDFSFNKIAKNDYLINCSAVEVGVVYFGGEPLTHFKGLEHLVSRMRYKIQDMNEKFNENKFKPLIILNTNGTLFKDNVLDFLNLNKDIIEIIISFDGYYHNKYRIYKSGEATESDVVAGIKAIRDLGLRFSITCTVPPDEIRSIDKNVKYITDMFGKDTEINLSFVRGPVPQVTGKITYPGVLEAQYTKDDLKIFGRKVAKMIRDGYNIFSKRFVARAREGGYMVRCPAAIYEFCVYLDGNVYPCHNFIDEKFKIGNINEGNFDPSKSNIIDIFQKRMVNRGKCGECVFQSICLSSFDCPSHSYYDLNDFYAIDDKTCVAATEIMTALFEKFILENSGEDNANI